MLTFTLCEKQTFLKSLHGVRVRKSGNEQVRAGYDRYSDVDSISSPWYPLAASLSQLYVDAFVQS